MYVVTHVGMLAHVEGVVDSTVVAAGRFESFVDACEQLSEITIVGILWLQNIAR